MDPRTLNSRGRSFLKDSARYNVRKDAESKNTLLRKLSQAGTNFKAYDRKDRPDLNKMSKALAMTKKEIYIPSYKQQQVDEEKINIEEPTDVPPVPEPIIETKPLPVKNLSYTVEHNSITLSWEDDNSDNMGYLIVFGNNTSLDNSVTVKSTTVNITPDDITSLTIIVKSVCESGISDGVTLKLN